MTVAVKNVVVKEVVDDREQTVPLQVEEFLVDPAYVEVGASVTRNLGNYESLRVHVEVRIPCYKEQLQQRSEEIAGLVQRRLVEELDAYLKDREAGVL
jgi:hypothetical protein